MVRPRLSSVRRLRRSAAAFLTSEDGPTTVEYAVMLALILGTIFGTVGALGGAAGGLYDKSEDEFRAAGIL